LILFFIRINFLIMQQKLRKWVVGSSMLLLITYSPDCAAFQSDNRSQTIVSQPVKGDHYAASGTVTVNARIGGDLVAAGGTILVNDSVGGDALLAGGTITLNGPIGDDVRAVGGTITILRNVSGDVHLLGGELTLDPAAVINGDLVVAGGKATVNGTVNGTVRLRGGETQLNGITKGDLEAKGGKLLVNGSVLGMATLAAREITIGDQARFGQDVVYWQQAGPLDFQGQVGGMARFDESLAMDIGQTNWYFLGFGSFVFVLFYLGAVLLLLYLFEYLIPGLLKEAGEKAQKDTTRSFGYGMLYLLGVPALCLMLLITIVGIPVGLFASVLYIFSLAFAHVISSLVLVNWYNLRYQREWNLRQLVWAGLGIFVVVKLVTLVPFLGWLLSVLLIGVAFGAIISSLRQRKIALAPQPTP
jgi:hypothetical protein